MYTAESKLHLGGISISASNIEELKGDSDSDMTHCV